MIRRSSVAVLLLMLSIPWGARANPITQDPCPGAVTGPVVWKQLGNDVLENLLFADDALWISDGTAGAVRRFDAAGVEGTGLSGIPSPGGLAREQDGAIVAGWGNSLANALLRTGAAKVVRFSPAAPNATLTTVAEGFNMPNGLILGPEGEIYISNDLDYGLIRIEPDGSWREFSHVWGANGMAIVGDSLYAAVTFDQRSPIARIPLDDPTEFEHDIQLTYGAASLEPAVYTGGDPDRPLVGLKGLDDMTRDDDGILYAVANGMGELLRVDPSDGSACLIASGLQNPSSVRIAPEGSGFADGDPATIDFYVTEFSGAVRLIRYAG